MTHIVKACPRCGSRDILIIDDRDNEAACLCCPACQHTGSPAIHEDHEEAIRRAVVLWNLNR